MEDFERDNRKSRPALIRSERSSLIKKAGEERVGTKRPTNSMQRGRPMNAVEVAATPGHLE